MFDRPHYDALHGLLSSYAPKARIFATPSFCGHWQASSKVIGTAMFHFVGAGDCWLHLPEWRQPLYLDMGGLIFFPRGDTHVLSSLPELEGENDFERRNQQDKGATNLLCGLVEFGVTTHNLLLDALPNLVLIPNARSDLQSASGRLLDLMLMEAQCDDYAAQMVMDKLADVLFVMVLRHYLNNTADKKGVLAALCDTRLRPVISALHRDYGQVWQVEQMAALACMSRTAFMRHFKEVLGVPPLDYLARFRMNRAEILLLTNSLSVAEIAEQIDYRSETAFRHAFKRHTGTSPGMIQESRRR